MVDSYIIDVPRFTTLTIIKPWRLVELEKHHPGFLAAHLEQETASIEDQLRHRYVVPFPARHKTIEKWVTAIVQRDALLEIGVEGNDTLWVEVVARAELAEKQIAEAADTQSAKWNLPLRDGKDATGIAKGGPLGYAETSPFDWTDQQVSGGPYGGQ
jgi:hypothetical protein